MATLRIPGSRYLRWRPSRAALPCSSPSRRRPLRAPRNRHGRCPPPRTAPRIRRGGLRAPRKRCSTPRRRCLAAHRNCPPSTRWIRWRGPRKRNSLPRTGCPGRMRRGSLRSRRGDRTRRPRRCLLARSRCLCGPFRTSARRVCSIRPRLCPRGVPRSPCPPV